MTFLLKKNSVSGILLIAFLFFVLYYQVFFADYIYLDEIHELWHNQDGLLYSMCVAEGRSLTGLLYKNLFSKIFTMEQMKYARIFSLSGWILVTILWQIFFSAWAKKQELDKRLILLLTIYIICCIPVAIFIGWAPCSEMFLGIAAGLSSGYIFFGQIQKRNDTADSSFIPMIISFMLGIVSLFIYQNTFGIFLLPFFFYYLKKQTVKPGRLVIIGILFYLLTHFAYFLLFKYSLKINGVQPSVRTGISINIPGKLSFLFSDLLPESFLLNILYSARSIALQIAAPLMIALWISGIFVKYKSRKIYSNLLYVAAILFFLSLMYLPSMIAKESFASYRTLFVFNLAVFYLLADQVFYFCKTQRSKTIAFVFITLFLVGTGFYNYNFQFVKPLKAEFKSFNIFMQKHTGDSLKTVYFIRADRKMFNPFFHTEAYKDEFGAPSTSRDWVPEFLVKQFVLEKTGSRALSDNIKVVQFADSTEFNAAKIQLSADDLFIDMNKIFENSLKKNE